MDPILALDQQALERRSLARGEVIQMNSPFPNAALWEAEVKKMIGPFGAPISDADAKAILEYLKTNYGS